MQSGIQFDIGPSAKRKRTVRACEQCQSSKKRCAPSDGEQSACKRCAEESRPCSFGIQPATPVSFGTGNVPEDSLDGHNVSPSEPLPTLRINEPQTELRYATMLEIAGGKDFSGAAQSGSGPTKLIGDTNPLSALLRKELKHKIVNNLCDFRTPDPLPVASRPSCSSPGEWDWDQHYASLGMSVPRLDYLRALGCFKVPDRDQSSRLLDAYFHHVHPLLPIVDRKDFLARYYGLDQPPPLVLLLAVMLAATRYCPGILNTTYVDNKTSVRDQCDVLHTRIKALADFDIRMERQAVLQASVLASLHWEGREGINSSLDALSLSVRIAQEMGLHRCGIDSGLTNPLLRRVWWSVYTLDRFNAAMEGTPFIINELDCDILLLCEEDFADEDQVVRDVTSSNTKLANIVNDAVRSLYAPGIERSTLYSRFGETQRDRLLRATDELQSSIMPHTYWSLLFMVHADAVRLLIHRPFLLHQDTKITTSVEGAPLYRSRELSRLSGSNIVSNLLSLRSQAKLGLTWPTTVYALVSALLIVWYDFTSPQEQGRQAHVRQTFIDIIGLLEEMGQTWWAAAAKHKLALTLFKIGTRLRERSSPDLDNAEAANEVAAASQLLTPVNTAGDQPSSAIDNSLPDSVSAMDDLFATTFSDADFWPLLGLDFDTELVEGIYGIS